MADKTQTISTSITNQGGNGGNNVKPVASSAPASFAPFFRRRTLGRGRAPSPPTWGCYEQIPLGYSDSEDVDDDDDEDEDDEDDEDEDDDDNYVETDSDNHSVSGSESGTRPAKPRGIETQGHAMEMEMDMGREPEPKLESDNAHKGDDGGRLDRMDMDVDGESRTFAASDAECACDRSADGEQCSDHAHGCHCQHHESETQQKKQDKGKQRAVEPVSSSSEKNEQSAEKATKKRQRDGNRNRKRRDRESSQILRPILTIKKSDGFVWNQDLFVPSYIKDRYISSTSPPSSNLVSSSSSGILTNDFNDNYEIEVVEIRVQGNELEGILS